MCACGGVLATWATSSTFTRLRRSSGTLQSSSAGWGGVGVGGWGCRGLPRREYGACSLQHPFWAMCAGARPAVWTALPLPLFLPFSFSAKSLCSGSPPLVSLAARRAQRSGGAASPVVLGVFLGLLRCTHVKYRHYPPYTIHFSGWVGLSPFCPSPDHIQAFKQRQGS